MPQLQGLVLRPYQQQIVNVGETKNTLVILPTGVGKTAIAVMLALKRLEKHPASKVVITAPTKPLCMQHLETFRQHTNIQDKIVLLTGAAKPAARKELWEQASVVVATPQTIQAELSKKTIDLKNVSLLCLDEAHRSRAHYAMTHLAKEVMQQSACPRILALTASPGSSKQRIDELCQNLFIESVEIRTEEDEDVAPYLQKREIRYREVPLSPDVQHVVHELKTEYRALLPRLHDFGITKPINVINKKDLLLLQSRCQQEIRQGNPRAFYGISLVAQLLKLDHAVALAETQSLASLHRYFGRLASESSKAAKKVMENKRVEKVRSQVNEFVTAKKLHPKQEELVRIIQGKLQEDPHARIMVFANYRDTVDDLVTLLKMQEGAHPVKLVGQKEGITQKEQAEVIRKFVAEEANVLIATSIGEEGISIGEATLAVFYDAVPSEIRTIQRRGRVGRIQAGEVIVLIAKGTRDEAFRWTAHRKEKTMRQLVEKIKKREELQQRL